MEAIEQLKDMRNDALSRLQNNADYRLLTSLDNLIVDLETMHHSARPKFTVVDDVTDKEPESEISELPESAVEKAFGELTADLDSDGIEHSDGNGADTNAISFN